MKKIISAMLICVLLCGCDVMNRSYTDITPHLLDSPSAASMAGERVENYAGLKSAILHLVEQGLESGVIRMYSYAGDATADIKAACRETMLDEPLGAYAVEYVGYEIRKILAYYEATVSITYRRTAEQIASVLALSTGDFQKAVSDLYLSGGTSLVAYLTYYYDDPRFDPAAIIESVHYQMPLDGFVMPQVSVALYPDTGWRRVVEVSLDYGEFGGSANVQSTARRLRNMAATLPFYPEDLGEVLFIRRLVDEMNGMAELVYPDASPYADTAYGFFIEGAASDEGFALALKGILDFQGIESMVVFGRRNGAPGVWNLVKIGDSYYHVDVTVGQVLKTDAELSETHEHIKAYPPADGQVIEAVAEPDDINREVY